MNENAIFAPLTSHETPFMQKVRERPAVAILLATCNGEACLLEQLESFASQTHQPALIMVSDDGSTDATCQIIRDFHQSHPELEMILFKGPRRGAAQNFLSLLRRVPDWIDIAALSDQDDVWFPDKISQGGKALMMDPHSDRPRLYCGRSWECSETLENKRLSRGLKHPAGFRHALVQNVAGGNTMMLNRAAIDIVRDASREARKIVVHDWWLYQIISGVGGEIIFDHTPQLLYRQHQQNLIGANRGLAAKKKRLRMLWSGRFRRWNTININALHASRHRLTPENREILKTFAQERNRSLLRRIWMIRKIGLYRQGLTGTLSLYLAAVLRRI